MEYPSSLTVESSLLRFLYERGGSVKSNEVYAPLGALLGLSVDDMQRSLDEVQGYGGERRKWDNMVQWARNSLAKKGFVLRPSSGTPHGVWTLTEKGSSMAAGLSTVESADRGRNLRR